MDARRSRGISRCPPAPAVSRSSRTAAAAAARARAIGSWPAPWGRRGLATLLIDLLTPGEEAIDRGTLDRVAALAGEFFERHLQPAAANAAHER